MSTPTEILYWEILPSIRSAIVFEMRDNHQLKQKDIAELLNVTPAAISQYLKQKRGNFVFTESFKLEIKNSVDLIISKKSLVFDQTNKLIKLFQTSKDICIVCSEKNNLKNCTTCYD
jgi:predicted transcriptional regulator